MVIKNNEYGVTAFFEGITAKEMIGIHDELAKNKEIDAAIEAALVHGNWYKNRFVVPTGKSKKFYEWMLRETKQYIDYHKNLARKYGRISLAQFSLEGYIEKETKLRQILSFLKNPNRSMDYSTENVRNAKLVPITNFIEFNRTGMHNCLWHNEKTPSMKYNQDTNTVHCFGACAKTYDVIDVIQNLHQIDFISALKMLNNSK